MCYRCWVAANRQEARYAERVGQEQAEQPVEEQLRPTAVPSYKRLANTSRRCLFRDCQCEDLHRVPLFLKRYSLIEYSLYVPDSARICTMHMHTNDWDTLYEFAETVFTPDQLKDIVDLLRDAYKTKSAIDFDNIEYISPEELYFRTGLTHEQFANVLSETPSLTQDTKRPKTLLGCFLMKIRSGEPDDRIACHLNINRKTVRRYLKKTRDCLTSDFVPRHLGYDHISREEILNHNLTIPTALFGSNVDPKATIMFDGTYIYIQKSKNFWFQKRTYSLHKFKNLLKPFLLVCADGYIIDILGPYAATTSDAQIMTQMMNNESCPIHYLLQQNDVFILDRGFRDSISNIETCGYVPHMPPTKDRNATQLSNEQANKSRLVTIVRWVIEAINGRFKRDFKIFRNQMFNKSLPNLFTDFRIAGALLNAFREPFHDSVYAETFIEQINSRMNTTNNLGNYVVAHNVNRQRAAFVTMNNESINISFPHLTDEDIILFSLGTYHLKLARSYVSEHLRGGVYNIEVCSSPSPRLAEYGLETERSTLLRGRILSRHRSNTTYYTYLLIRNGNDLNAIQAYYCSCLTGMRTVGACAHVVSILWYFGVGRHLPNFIGPACAWDDIIIDSANAE